VRIVLVACVIAVSVAAAGVSGSTAYPGCAPGPDLHFRASDGTRLVGHRFGRGKIAIVLAHEYGRDLCEWVPYAKRLAGLGYTAIAFDLRGFGGSNPGTGSGLTSYDRDVAAAAKLARAQGATKVLLVGASIGANAVVVAGASIKPTVDGVVSLSAPATFRLDAVSAVKRSRVPVLYVAGTIDSGGIYRQDARTLFAATAAADKAITLVATGEHGVQLVGHPGKARSQVERFLHVHSR
jgi:alpha-beta hydrolase superfamily lysophospholipase